ncbi:YqzM family protein [Aquibacillus albus]|uniref:YqzM family protein n=1 Tax=Aquibacillus albus TaxID=1168171 RepID=A0ABS2MUW5_9BACI|nr:YqzM family protein [Aquibacillus albus]MBM7569603.1 hypothetical protein [Aquibacillus albus]
MNEFEKDVQSKSHDIFDSGIGFIFSFIFFMVIFFIGVFVDVIG